MCIRDSIFERDPEGNLELNAFDGAVLSDQRKIQRVDVDRVSFKIHKKIGKPDSIKVTYHCGLAEYYEWLTPFHSDFGMKKTNDILIRFDFNFEPFRSTLLGIDEYICYFSSFGSHSQKITAIDILPSKYTEVKKRYWSKV